MKVKYMPYMLNAIINEVHKAAELNRTIESITLNAEEWEQFLSELYEHYPCLVVLGTMNECMFYGVQILHAC